MKIKAKITYNIDGNHPDIGDLPEKYWKDKVFTYEDTYDINPDSFFGEDDISDYIKNDLLLVAGGGYNWEHVYHYIIEMWVGE